MKPQAAQHPVGLVDRAIGNHHDYVPVFASKTVYQVTLLNQIKELDNIGLKFSVSDLHPAHAFASEIGHDLHGIFILEHVFAECRGLSLNAKSLYPAASCNDLPENRIIGIPDDIRDIFKTHIKTKVRPVRAVAVHSLCVGHARKRFF